MTGVDPELEWRGPERGPEPSNLPATTGGADVAHPSGQPESPEWPAKLGMWLLWLCVGLPASTLVFLGIPAFLALLALASLAEGGLEPERLAGPWLSLGPWLALGALGVLVNHRASHHHRRPPRDTRTGRRVWLVIGLTTNLGALILIGLELTPETQLHPEIHYVGLSLGIAWWVLSLAYLSGRVVSALAAPVERWAVRSQAVSGGLTATGPMTAIALVAVVGSNIAHEGIENSLGAKSLTSSSSPASGMPGMPAPRWSFNRCIEELYQDRLGKASSYAYEVRRVQRSFRSGLDAHSIASDAAIRVCLKVEKDRKQMWSKELYSYYRSAVTRGAQNEIRKGRRIDFRSCRVNWDPQDPLSPILEDELTHRCLHEQLCAMKAEDRAVLMPFLLGSKAREIAKELGTTTAKVQNQLKGSKRRFKQRAIEACIR